jgi:hypothetical protein
MKHGPLYPREILYPVKLPRRHKAISRAVSEVVARTKPRSLCVCGEFCATHRKLVAERIEK